MSSLPERLDRNQFRFGFNAQSEWRWLITAAFFFGKVGGGLFVISWFLDDRVGGLVALLLVGVGKSTAHLLFLGKPLRAWRALAHWRTSWISRGLIAIVVFCAATLVWVVVGDEVSGAIGLAAALVVMTYDGFVLRTATGIPLWTSWFVPLLVAMYALLGGATISLIIGVADEGRTAGEVEWLQLAFLGANVVLIAIYLATIQVRGAASRLAGRVLMRGPLAIAFVVGALLIGLGATIALAAVSIATGSDVALAIAAGTDLAGHFLFFLAILMAGTYEAPQPLPALRALTAQ